MVNRIEGSLSGKGKKFAVVVSRFNEFITGKLLDGFMDGLLRHDVNEADVAVFVVPGSFEAPLAAMKAAETGQFDAVTVLTTIIRGDTTHYDHIAAEVTKGIAAASMETGIPIVYGVITAESLEQAINRAGAKQGNRGFDAAMTALEMADLMRKIK